MSVEAAPHSLLFDSRPIDEEDATELSMIHAARAVNILLEGKSHSECQRLLLEGSCDSMEKHAEYNLAILLNMLSATPGDPRAEQYFHYLQVIVRDSYAFFNAKLRYLIDTKYVKMLARTKEQLMWLFVKLRDSGSTGADAICLAIIRQMRTGDVSNMNLWLCDTIAQILGRNPKWLFRHSVLVGSVFYAYARLVLDHGRFVELRNKELKLLLYILRERFDDCAAIGRDFIRLLHDLSKFPEFDVIWNTVLTSISSLSSTYKDLSKILDFVTPKKYLQSRLTPIMESYLLFIMEKVKLGHQKRYQLWFQQMFLSMPDCESLVPDLIRFICVCYHPSNEVLASEIIPRYAVIGWLITSVKNPMILTQCRLCLFYDWMFFNLESGESLMNMEPALLLMYKSLPRYADLTLSLIEFLNTFAIEILPGKQNLVLAHLRAGMKFMASKGVVANPEHLFNASSLSEKTKQILGNLFAASEVLRKDPDTLPSLPSPIADRRFSLSPHMGASSTMDPRSLSPRPDVNVKNNVVVENASFSDVDASDTDDDTDDDTDNNNNNNNADDADDDAEGFLKIRKVILGCDFKCAQRSSSLETSMLDSEFFSKDSKRFSNFLCRNGSSIINELSVSIVVERANKNFADIHGILGNVDLVRKIIDLEGRFAALLLRHCFSKGSSGSQKHELELYKNLFYTGNETLHHLHIWQTLFPNSYFTALPSIIETFYSLCDIRGNWDFVHLLVVDARPQDISRLERWFLTSGAKQKKGNNNDNINVISSDEVYLIGSEPKTIQAFISHMFPQIKGKGLVLDSIQSRSNGFQVLPEWQITRILGIWIIECESRRKTAAKPVSDFLFKHYIHKRDPRKIPVSLFNFWTRVRNLCSVPSSSSSMQPNLSSSSEDLLLEEPETKKPRIEPSNTNSKKTIIPQDQKSKLQWNFKDFVDSNASNEEDKEQEVEDDVIGIESQNIKVSSKSRSNSNSTKNGSKRSTTPNYWS